MFKNITLLGTLNLGVNPAKRIGVPHELEYNKHSKSVKNMAVVRVNIPASYAG